MRTTPRLGTTEGIFLTIRTILTDRGFTDAIGWLSGTEAGYFIGQGTKELPQALRPKLAVLTTHAERGLPLEGNPANCYKGEIVLPTLILESIGFRLQGGCLAEG